MRREPLLYLTYADIDPLIFESQVLGFCDFIQRAYGIPVQIICFEEAHQAAQIGSYASDVTIERMAVEARWWESSDTVSSLLALFQSKEVSSFLSNDPRMVPLCTAAQALEIPFFYQAITCRYLELAEEGSATSAWVQELKALESRAFKQADWIYASTEELILHFKDEAAYRDHNHSIMPLAALSLSNGSEPALPAHFQGDENIVFCYAGPIDLDKQPRAVLESFAAILKEPSHRLLILTEDNDLLDAFPFLNHPNCLKRSLSLAEAVPYMSMADYGLLLAKNNAHYTYAGSLAFVTYVSLGTPVIISPELRQLADLVTKHQLGLHYAGRKTNDILTALTKPSPEQRTHIKKEAKRLFDKSEASNQIKFRNLKRLHDRV
jgi:hypothetical protein